MERERVREEIEAGNAGKGRGDQALDSMKIFNIIQLGLVYYILHLHNNTHENTYILLCPATCTAHKTHGRIYYIVKYICVYSKIYMYHI